MSGAEFYQTARVGRNNQRALRRNNVTYGAIRFAIKYMDTSRFASNKYIWY